MFNTKALSGAIHTYMGHKDSVVACISYDNLVHTHPLGKLVPGQAQIGVDRPLKHCLSPDN